MRIIFMGTPEFAVPCLEQLIQDGHEVIGVFTQPDKPKGRGYSMAPPPVKQAALKAGIPVYQPASVKTEEAFAQLKALAPELIVVVAYGKILPKAVLELPEYGCINVSSRPPSRCPPRSRPSPAFPGFRRKNVGLSNILDGELGRRAVV